MNFFTKTLNKLFKSGNQLELNKIKPIVAKIKPKRPLNSSDCPTKLSSCRFFFIPFNFVFLSA